MSPTEPDFLARLGDIPDPTSARSSVAPLDVPAVGASPDRRAVRRLRISALAVSLAWLGTHLAVYGLRSDLPDLPPAYVAALIGIPLAAAAGSLMVALRAGRLGLGASIGLVSALAVLGPASFLLIGSAPWPGVSSGGTASLGDALLCFDITLAWAVVPLLAAAWSLRGAFAAGARWRSALVGAGIGLFAGATMNLHCPNVAPLHISLGHGLPVLLATLAGAGILAYRARA